MKNKIKIGILLFVGLVLLIGLGLLFFYGIRKQIQTVPSGTNQSEVEENLAHKKRAESKEGLLDNLVDSGTKAVTSPSPVLPKQSSVEKYLAEYTKYNSYFPPIFTKDWYPGYPKSNRAALIAEVQNAVRKSGVILGGETWSGAILLTGDVEIRGSLRILPGTHIFAQKGQQDYKVSGDCALVMSDPLNPADPALNCDFVNERVGIYVFGSLIAEGTKEKPIILTSAELSPSNDDWLGIFGEEGSGILRMLRVISEWSVFGVKISGGRPHISENIIRNTMAESIDVDSGGSDFLPDISKNYFYNSGHFAIKIQKGSPSFRNNIVVARQVDYDAHGFEYGAVFVACGASPKIENNFIHGGYIKDYGGIVKGVYNINIDSLAMHFCDTGKGRVSRNTFFDFRDIRLSQAEGMVGPSSPFEFNNIIAMRGALFLEAGEEAGGSSVTIDLKNNFWGTDSRSRISGKLRRDNAKSEIIFEPFAKEFIPEALPDHKNFIWE